MAEELWVEEAGVKRGGAEGPGGWQSGVDRGGVGRVGDLGKAMRWAERGGCG